VVRSFRASKTALAAATLDRWLPASKISSSNAEGTMGEGRRIETMISVRRRMKESRP
jgi:hypothetical protein